VKLATSLFVLALLIVVPQAVAAPLDNKSKSPDWGHATPAEKDAWLASFPFKKAEADKTKVAACLDKYAVQPLFETGDLSGTTGLCETISELPE
jgi:hypothetical protein